MLISHIFISLGALILSPISHVTDVTLEIFICKFLLLIAKLNYSHDVHRHTYIIRHPHIYAPSCLFI